MNAATTTLMATALAVTALGLTACASEGGGGRPGKPVAGPSASSHPTSHPVSTIPTPLASIVDQRDELPRNFDVTDQAGPLLPRSYDDALHTCLGLPTTSSQVLGHASAEAGHDGPGYTGVAVNSTAVRYRSQAPVDRFRTVLLSPAAEHCYRTVLLRMFRQYNAGSGIVEDRTTVHARSTREPANVAGVVEFHFHSTRGVRHHARSTMVYVTGPRTLGCISFLGFGRAFDAGTQRRMTTAFASRLARG